MDYSTKLSKDHANLPRLAKTSKTWPCDFVTDTMVSCDAHASKNNQEILITEQKSVENKIFLFYKNLFSNKDPAQSETVESLLDTS